MTDDGPEFHTRAVTPLSPLPLHPPIPPESSNLPILRNQTDPVFNMTSTHLAPHESEFVEAPVDTAIGQDDVVEDDKDDSSDPFAEDDNDTSASGMATTIAVTDQSADDYAMTFDSDGAGEGDGNSSTQDVPNTIVDQNLTSDAAVPNIADTAHPTEVVLPSASSTSLQPSQNFPSYITSHSEPTPVAPTVSEDAAVPNAHTAASEPTQLPKSGYEGIENGEIDIQQLLDNITANAENNASTPSSAKALPTSYPMSGASDPAHSSLPPRPPAQQRQAMNASGYHVGPSGYSSYGPSGASMPLAAAGAPGTSTGPRTGLPPPPTASFAAQSSLPTNSQNAYPQTQRSGAGRSSERGDSVDDPDAPWGPATQKLYDDFLADERMYVTEGLWDRFPAGSRLFIGMPDVLAIL
jgi:nuclear polyadenylated RNA-binding protein 3